MPSINDIKQARQAILNLTNRVDKLAADMRATGNNQSVQDDRITRDFVQFGVRIGVVTTEVTAATSLDDLGCGIGVLTNRDDPTIISDDAIPFFNISEDIYPVGTRVGVVEIAGSFFILSDSGVDPVVVLPVVDLVPLIGDTYFEWVHGYTLPLTSVVPRILVTDSLDVGDRYLLRIDAPSVVFTLTAGDSGITNLGSSVGGILLVADTLAALDNFLQGGTTGTLEVTPAVGGVLTLSTWLREETTGRTSLTSSIEVIVFGGTEVQVEDQGTPIVTTSTLNFSGPNVVVTESSGTALITVSDATGGTEYDVQVFPSSGTWTKPANADRVYAFNIGGGGGGGSGRRAATGNVGGGGGGGGGGEYAAEDFDESSLGGTVTVTIGAAGSGGAGQTTNGTDGNAGGAGGDTTFGSFVTAHGGSGGGAGTTSAGTAGAGGTGSSNATHVNGGAGGIGGVGGVGTFAGVGNSPASGQNAGAGGGGGGGISSGNAPNSGNVGGNSNGTGGTFGFATGPLTTDAMAANPGGPGGSCVGFCRELIFKLFGGGGGGGGGASSTTNATPTNFGFGGTGGRYGAGGGGATATRNGSTVSYEVGGFGAPGICVVVTTIS